MTRMPLQFHELKPAHINGYVYDSPEWWEANHKASADALARAFIDYGGPTYQQPLWKTCDAKDWIKELLSDVEEFERRMNAPPRHRMKDVCIR
jgi:hypothetical protein